MNYYVYTLRSQTCLDKHFTGFTDDINDGLQAHNDGLIPTTSEFRPWDVKSFVAFRDKQRALDFEEYLHTNPDFHLSVDSFASSDNYQ